MEMEKVNQIEKDEKLKLPVWLWICVCFFSVAVGCFFGMAYQWPGVITAGLGGLFAGLVWCWIIGKLYAKPDSKWWKILLAGIALGIIVGVADGILLNLVGVTLIKIGYLRGGDFIPREYLEGVVMGSIFGAFGGFCNGLLWSIVAACLHSGKKREIKED